jgi:acetyl-CoA carboxylase biotin carboxyl carrier protein
MKDKKTLGERLTSGTAKNPAVDADVIRTMAGLLDETGLSEIEIERDGVRVRVARQLAVASATVPAGAVPAAQPPAPAEAPAEAGPPKGAVTSPMVGTVYLSPEPGKPPFVKVGDAVKADDTILIIEAMKTMNQITAPHAGTVREISVTDGQPVEFGQMLLVIA